MALFFCPGHNGRPGQQIQWQKEKVDEVHEIQRWTGEKGSYKLCLFIWLKKKKKISRENHKLFKKDRNERLKKKLFSESKVEGFIGIVIFDINLKIVMRCKLKLPQIVVCSS